MLVGIDDGVASAIAARDASSSIADDAGFMDTMSRLPSDRMMSVYLAPSAVDAVVALGSMGMPIEDTDTMTSLGVTGTATAVSLVDEGLLFSYVVVGGEGTAGALTPDESVLASLPDDTLGFISITGSTSAEDVTMGQDALADLGYPLDQLSEELGLDIVELIESLSGDLTFAATETRNSSIADATDVPVGVVGALGLTDTGPVEELIEMLEEMFVQQGLDMAVAGGVTSVVADGQELLSYSVADDLLIVGTGDGLVGDVASHSGGGLLGSELYRELDSAVVGDGLVLYVDVTRIAGLVPMTADEYAVITPMRGVGLGGRISGDTTLMEVLFLVDY